MKKLCLMMICLIAVAISGSALNSLDNRDPAYSPSERSRLVENGYYFTVETIGQSSLSVHSSVSQSGSSISGFSETTFSGKKKYYQGPEEISDLTFLRGIGLLDYADKLQRYRTRHGISRIGLYCSSIGAGVWLGLSPSAYLTPSPDPEFLTTVNILGIASAATIVASLLVDSRMTYYSDDYIAKKANEFNDQYLKSLK